MMTSALERIWEHGMQLAQGMQLVSIYPRSIWSRDFNPNFAPKHSVLVCHARCVQSEAAKKALRRCSKEQLCPLPWRRGSCKLHFQNVTSSEEAVYASIVRSLFNFETFEASLCQSAPGLVLRFVKILNILDFREVGLDLGVSARITNC